MHYLEKLVKNNEIHENAQAPAYEEHVDEYFAQESKYSHCGWNGARPTVGK